MPTNHPSSACRHELRDEAYGHARCALCGVDLGQTNGTDPDGVTRFVMPTLTVPALPQETDDA